MTRAPTVAAAHIVIVGVGGLGCPAAWALAEAGVGRLTLLDPDHVELSNLPRQILYSPEDVGRPKALVAASRLAASYPAREGQRIRGVHAPLDETNEADILGGADLLLDATDGARTKDWLNALAVRRGLPLVHAAALRSEGRLLDVPAGGKPCLACLFGRLEEESGRCADLGVWNGAVGAAGFLAAATALRRLARPDSDSPGYVMMDLESGRGVTLKVKASADCPVCADASRLEARSLPRDVACRAPQGEEAPVGGVTRRLDLRDEVCPLNLLRARRVVEDLEEGEILEILLGMEGAASVPDGLRALGHAIRDESPRAGGVRLVVSRGDGEAPTKRLERDALLRYARQVVLPEVGEEGQARLLGASVRLEGHGPTLETAVRYLEAAGVGRVDCLLAETSREATRAWIRGAGESGEDVAYTARVEAGRGGRVLEGDGAGGGGELPSPEARALGALLADRIQRRVVLGSAPSLEFGIVPEAGIQA